MNHFVLDTALLSGRLQDVRISSAGTYLQASGQHVRPRASPSLILADGRALSVKNLPDSAQSRSRLAALLQDHLDHEISSAKNSVIRNQPHKSHEYRILSEKIAHIANRSGAIGSAEIQKTFSEIDHFVASFSPRRDRPLLLKSIHWDGHNETLRARNLSRPKRMLQKIAMRFKKGRHYYAKKAATSFAQALADKYKICTKRNGKDQVRQAFSRVGLSFDNIEKGHASVPISLRQAIAIHEDLEKNDFSALDMGVMVRSAAHDYHPGNDGWGRIATHGPIAEDMINNVFLPHLAQRLEERFSPVFSQLAMHGRPFHPSSAGADLLPQKSVDKMASRLLGEVAQISHADQSRMSHAVNRYREVFQGVTEGLSSRNMQHVLSLMPTLRQGIIDTLKSDPLEKNEDGLQGYALERMQETMIDNAVSSMSQGNVRYLSHHLSEETGPATMFVLGALEADCEAREEHEIGSLFRKSGTVDPKREAAIAGASAERQQNILTMDRFLKTLVINVERRLGCRDTVVRRKLTALEDCYKAGQRARQTLPGSVIASDQKGSDAAVRDGVRQAAKLLGTGGADLVAEGMKGAGGYWTAPIGDLDG